MYQITFYVPVSHKEQVKDAVFSAGGGRIGNYDSCAFEIIGRGQFRPLKGAKPFLGQEQVVEYVEEAKVELVVEDQFVQSVVSALKNAHPYETVAYQVIKLEDF